jgi:hypothetical protein
LVHRRCQNRRPSQKSPRAIGLVSSCDPLRPVVRVPLCRAFCSCPFSLASCLLQLPGARSSGRFCTCRRQPRRGPRSGHSVQGTALPTAPTPSVPHRTRSRPSRIDPTALETLCSP